MFTIQQIFTLFLTLTMELNLTACVTEAKMHPTALETSESLAQV